MPEIPILIILIIMSGFFSGAEIAYVVANKLKMELQGRKKNIASRSVYFFSQNPQTFFSTILIGNNIINIAFASISTIFLSRVFGLSEGSILIVSTVIILLFGELIPKYFSRETADSMVAVSAVPLRIVSILLYPFIKVTSSLSRLLTQFSNITEETISGLFSREDIETLVNEGHEAGAVHKAEKDIIHRVFDLGEQRVYESMRPRTDIIGIDIHSSMDEVLNLFIESGYSKIPVFEDNLDNIKGVAYAYDIFKMPRNLTEIVREVIFVPETKKSFEMLNEFLSKQVSIAIVIDEFGGTAGLITMEDLLEELLGEIEDEYDVPEDICRKIGSESYIISGKVEIDFINEKYGLNLPSGDYETLGGMIISEIGRIPVQGETVSFNEMEFLIVRATPIKIDVVKITGPKTSR